MYGNEKSSQMQDRIISRVDRNRWRSEETKVEVLPKRAWTPERWAHRIPATHQTQTQAAPLDLTSLQAKFGTK